MHKRAGWVLAAVSIATLGLAMPSAGASEWGHRHNTRTHTYRQDENRGQIFRHLFLDHLSPVPHNPMASGNSHTSANSALIRIGNYVVATVYVRGAAPGLVHAQHIHGPGLHACPSPARDVNHDGLIDVTEGSVDYGPIVVSLTTSGDATPASALAVERFPTASSSGAYSYARFLRIGTDIPADVASHLSDFHIVVHGIDTNHNGAYDFSKGPSDLTPTLPQEATVPAACGLIR
jgi:hypothetical protein